MTKPELLAIHSQADLTWPEAPECGCRKPPSGSPRTSESIEWLAKSLGKLQCMEPERRRKRTENKSWQMQSKASPLTRPPGVSQSSAGRRTKEDTTMCPWRLGLGHCKAISKCAELLSDWIVIWWHEFVRWFQWCQAETSRCTAKMADILMQVHILLYTNLICISMLREKRSLVTPLVRGNSCELK